MHDYESEIPSNLISDNFFQNFPGGIPPDSPSIGMLRMLIVLSTINNLHLWSLITLNSLYTALQMIGLTTEKLLTTALSVVMALLACDIRKSLELFV